MPVNPTPSWFGFLRIEADLAMTFIRIGRNHLQLEYSARSLEKARKALAQIQHCLMAPNGYGLSEEEISFLERRCAEIESALDFEPGK
jgi:cob(I)alamin adenosyltransferase